MAFGAMSARASAPADFARAPARSCSPPTGPGSSSPATRRSGGPPAVAGCPLGYLERPRRRPRRRSRSSTAQRVAVPGDRARRSTPTASIRDARPRLDGREHRRREGVRRGGRGGAAPPPRRRRRARRGPPERALRPGGRRGGAARGRARTSTGEALRDVRAPVASPGSRRRGPCSSCEQSAATPPASPTTWARAVAGDAALAVPRSAEHGRHRRVRVRRRAGGVPGDQGSGISKCSSRSSKACLVPCSARVFTKLNSSVVELEVRAVGVEQVARAPLRPGTPAAARRGGRPPWP